MTTETRNGGITVMDPRVGALELLKGRAESAIPQILKILEVEE